MTLNVIKLKIGVKLIIFDLFHTFHSWPSIVICRSHALLHVFGKRTEYLHSSSFVDFVLFTRDDFMVKENHPKFTHINLC